MLLFLLAAALIQTVRSRSSLSAAVLVSLFPESNQEHFMAARLPCQDRWRSECKACIL
jgi:hypothetical protein